MVAADSDEKADFLSTSFKQLFLGIITGKRQLLQPPHDQLRLNEMEEGALAQMTAYSFIGSPTKVKQQLNGFIDETQIDELMVVTYVYDHEARVHSYELLKAL